MSKSNTTENDLVKFMFNNIAMPSYGNNLYVSLHTSDVGEAGDQTTNETTYTGYTRIAISRDVSGFAVSNNQSSNASLVQFPQCSGNPQVLTHIAIGTALNGAGQVLYSGALNTPLSVANLIQPQFAIAGLVITED